MTYVYILRSIQNPSKRYIGYTQDLKRRLAEHNNGGSKHTEKYRPWRIETYIAVESNQKAIELERYLKTGSGQAFPRRRL